MNLKVQDIIDTPNLPLDEYRIETFVGRLAEKLYNDYDWYTFPSDGIADFRIELKGSRNYDGNRGAELYVIWYLDAVICICSFAGRSLRDCESIYVYDHVKLRKLFDMFRHIEREKDKVFDPTEEINVVYWEGCPIQLGKDIFGYD